MCRRVPICGVVVTQLVTARFVPNSAGMALWVSSKPERTRMDVHALNGNRLRCSTSLLYRPSESTVPIARQRSVWLATPVSQP